MNFLTKLKHPFVFQGKLSKTNYFEGWYFKQVCLPQDKTISFIFGISTHATNPHAFIQVIRSNPLKTYYISYPIEQFSALKDGYQLGLSSFSQTQLHVNIETDDLSCVANLEFSQLSPLESTLTIPNIMGPFAYLGSMECNHGVVSMNHMVNGALTINGEHWGFSDDRGYIEKDWGTSFPKRYIWLQGNHFSEPHTQLMVSVADIPMGLFHFEGLIAQLYHPVHAKRLATYTFARKTKLTKTTNGFNLTLQQGKLSWQLMVVVDEKADLVSPKNGRMQNTIKEGLGGTITLRIYDQKTLVFEDTSHHCGIEIEGY
jgi:tocopherol cyclase